MSERDYVHHEADLLPGTLVDLYLSAVDRFGDATALQAFPFPDTDARYVRLVGFGNSESAWNSWTEIEVR